MNDIQPIATRVPPGNHESDVSYSYANYVQRFAAQNLLARRAGSNTNRYYSFNLGPVHFLALDTDAHVYPQVTWDILEDMFAWVQEDLANVNRTQTPWIILYSHRAMYCTTTFRECIYETQNIRDGTLFLAQPRYGGLKPLLKKYGIELYFAGHTQATHFFSQKKKKKNEVKKYQSSL